MIDPKGLQQALTDAQRLVVFLHDNPDPDAIAAAWLLADIAKATEVPSEMVHGGSLGRAENSAMVRYLDIPIHRYDPRRFKARDSDRFALVDSQPRAGNSSFPDRLEADVVIDHHPPRDDLKGAFVDVRCDAGCTTTMLLSYHQAFGLDTSPALATAAYYAIISETQDLGREASKADRDACLRLFPTIQLSTLGRIRHPPREREYYRTIARAMRQVRVGKNTCVCHIGPIPNVEMAAEVADFLMSMKHITWCLVSGLLERQMFVSIRASRPEVPAEQVIKQVLDGYGSGGGHEMMAGGSAPCDDEGGYRQLADHITNRFVENLPRRISSQLRPLLDEDLTGD